MRLLILLSGGIDSAVCAAMYRDHDRESIGFDYGQPHVIELESAERFACAEGIPFRVVKLPEMPKVNDVVFAGRNAVLLSYAVSYAAANGFDGVVIGTNASDHARFPDCRPTFLGHLREAFKAAYGILMFSPLQHMPKSEVISTAEGFGLDLSKLWTCYSPQPDRSPCGECYSCLGRKEAEA